MRYESPHKRLDVGPQKWLDVGPQKWLDVGPSRIQILKKEKREKSMKETRSGQEITQTTKPQKDRVLHRYHHIVFDLFVAWHQLKNCKFVAFVHLAQIAMKPLSSTLLSQ